MRRSLHFCLLFLLLAVAATDARSALGAERPRPTTPIPVEDSPASRAGSPVTLEDGTQLWLVTLSRPPAADDGSVADVLAEQNEFRNALAASGIRARERRSSHSLWNGIALAVRPGDAARLLTLPGVIGVYPAAAIPLPEEPPTLDPALMTALSMTGADIVHSRLGLTGAGVRVGIVDSGIDYDHADLGGDGVTRRNSTVFPTARVVAGYDLVGDAFSGSSAPVPDPFPDDCSGHGTHVAGIVGARGSVTGVAPGVVFGAYRVFGCGLFSTPDVVIAALEHALADGMQVINLSLGLPFQWPSHPLAEACDRLVKRGVVVCSSIGNSGAQGLYAGGSPAVGSRVIGVAGFDNVAIHDGPEIHASPDGAAFGYLNALGAPLAPLSGTFPLTRTGATASTEDGCVGAPAGIAGKVALIGRSGCTVYTKARNAEAAGAIAVIVYNDADRIFAPDARGTPAVTIPVVGISASAGATLDGRLAAGTVDISWSVASSANPFTGGRISATSSWGPAPDLSLKPDLGAPGGYIFSTYPVERGGYISMSGTSMASPHVAGAAALLLQADPRIKPDELRARLMNTAAPAPYPGASGGLDAVQRQGAGMIQIDDAILATTLVEPAALELGESSAGPQRRKLTIDNRADHAVTYRISQAQALATGPDTFSPTVQVGEATASFSASSIRVPHGGKGKLDVAITPDPALASGTLFGGYVVLTPDDRGREIRVPYLGYAGDYQSLPALVPTSLGLPWLIRIVDGLPVNQPGGGLFTLQGDDLPYILLHLDRPVSELEMEVFDAVTGRTWHRMFFAEDYPRSLGALGATAFPWNGSTQQGKKLIVVPNGRYVVKVTVLKPLGDPHRAGDIETWTSPVITLARPAPLAGAATGNSAAEIPAAAEATTSPHEAWLAASPNPFVSSAVLRFTLPAESAATLVVFDPLGRRLRAWRWTDLPAGDHAVAWDGHDNDGRPAPAGLLLMRLETPTGTLTRKVVRVR